MTEQPDLFGEPKRRDDRQRARQLRDEGIRRAVDHADRVLPTWGDRAFAWFQEYARTHIQFTTEDVRWHAEGRGFEAAPDSRAWGAVATRAVRDGIVAKNGHVPCRNPLGHMGIRTLWRVP